MNYLHSFILVAWSCDLLHEHHPHHSSWHTCSASGIWDDILLAIMQAFLSTYQDTIPTYSGHCLCIFPCCPLIHTPLLCFYPSPHLWHCVSTQYPACLLYSLLCSPCIHIPGAMCSLHLISIPSACLYQLLSSLQEPGRKTVFDSSTLSAKCIQI